VCTLCGSVGFLSGSVMAKKFPIHPSHPERICWGCDKYCSVGNLKCGNGSERTQHPVELFGDDWFEVGSEQTASSDTSEVSEEKTSGSD
jgi:hypothetical protein